MRTTKRPASFLKYVFLIIALFVFATNSFNVALAAKKAGTLSDLTGWRVPGLEKLPVKNVKSGQGFISATIKLGSRDVSVVVFKGNGQSKSNVAINLGNLELTTLVPALKNTPFDDFEFKNASFIIAPKGNAKKGVKLPTPVAGDLGLKNLDIIDGVGLHGITNFKGRTGALLSSLGVRPSQGFSLSGSIDYSVFKGKKMGGRLTKAFIDNLDLTIPLPGLHPSWKPSFLDIKDSFVSFKGEGGKLVSSIAASIDITVGGKRLAFDDVTVSYNAKTKKTIISSASIDPGNALTLPMAGARINSISFSAVVGDSDKSFNLNGAYTVEGKKGGFTAELQDKDGHAEYDITIDGTASLTKLTGWKVPGLEDISVNKISFGTGFTSGMIEINGHSVDLAIFKRKGQSKPNVALSFGNISLSTFVPPVKGTPLDDLVFKNASFIVVPQGNAGKSVALPSPVATHLGSANVDLDTGVNLKGGADLKGELKELAGLVGIHPMALPISGGLDPSVFKGGAKAGASKLAEAFIDNLDITIPLGTIRVTGIPPFVHVKEGFLVIKGKEGSIVGSVSSGLTLNVKGKKYEFDASIGSDKEGGEKYVVIDGDFKGKLEKPFGIHWLTLRDVTLHASLGKDKDVSFSGTTDIGSIKNLIVTSFINTDGGTVTDAGIELTGADIPLNSIPLLKRIPNTKNIKFRDLTISERSIGGTLKTNMELFNGLTAVVFESKGKWSLAILKQGFSLADVLNLPGPAKEIFSDMKLDKAAFVISDGGLDSKLVDMPQAAQTVLLDIYGNKSREIRLPSGLSFITALEPKSVGKLTKTLGVEGNMVLEGAIEGIFGGEPAFDLAAVIPPIKMPREISFLKLPDNVETSFYFKLAGVEAAVGVGITTYLHVNTKHEQVKFDTTIDFQMDTEGGFTIAVAGKMDSAWHNPFGIKGLSLDPGTGMSISVSATSEIDFSITGNTHIGKKMVDLSGAIALIDFTPAEVAFEGKTSELGTNDLVAMVNATAKAAGKKQIKPNFPAVTLKNVDLAFASPGTIGQKYGLDEGGLRLSGDLWFLIKGAPLGSLTGQITDRGLMMKGDITNFTTGPVTMRNNKLDVNASLSIPPEPPHFKISGDAMLFNNEVDGEVILTLTKSEVVADLDFGKLLMFDFHAWQGLPSSSVSVAELAKYDLGIHASLKSDIPGWLRSDGKKYVQGTFDDITKDIQATIDALNTAQAKVDDLDKKITAARKKAKADMAKARMGVDEAQKKVDSLSTQISKTGTHKRNAQSHIHKCNYKKKICTWRDPWKNFRCTKHAWVTDVGRDASCATTNAKYGIIVAADATTIEGLKVAKQTARQALSDIKSGLSSSATIDLDPRVAPLIVEKQTATEALNLAKQAAEGAKEAEDILKRAINTFADNNAFVLKNSLIQGSLQKAIKGVPAVIGMDVVIFNKEYHLGYAFSFTDMAFNANQLEAVALFIATQAVEIAAKEGKVPPSLTQALQNAYTTKHNAVQKDLDAAMKANGL